MCKMTKLKPITKTINDEIKDVYFDVTIIIDKDNNAVLIDNYQYDWKDFVDCNTLIVKELKLRP